MEHGANIFGHSNFTFVEQDIGIKALFLCMGKRRHIKPDATYIHNGRVALLPLNDISLSFQIKFKSEKY